MLHVSTFLGSEHQHCCFLLFQSHQRSFSILNIFSESKKIRTISTRDDIMIPRAIIKPMCIHYLNNILSASCGAPVVH